MTIDVVFRNEKGDELTWEEMDSNLANLQVAIETKKDNFSILPVSQGGTGVSTIEEAKQALDVPEFANQIEYMPSGVGAVATNVQEKLREITKSVKDYGAVCDGINDDTDAFQKAINYASSSNDAYTISIPGVCRLTDTINISSAIRIIGEGCSPYVGTPGSRGDGSWLYFDHTGVGISVDGTGLLSGISFEKFGTFRNQPEPTAGWTPNDHEYDISIDNADVYIDDVMMLNPTRGVLLKNGEAGRLHINRLRGQAFKEFVRVDKSYDVVRINSIHQWPFWRDNANVHSYTMDNLDVIYLLRCDNPIINDPFSIFSRSGLRIGEGSSGTTSKFRVSNPDFDRGAFALWVDPSVTSGCNGKVVNLEHQGETGLVGSKAIFIQGSNNSITFVNTTSALSSQNAVRVEGTGNVLTFSGRTHLYNFNQIADFFPAVEVLSGNTVSFYEQPEISGDGGTGGSYGGAGTIKIGPNGLRRGNFDTYIVSGESSRNGEIEFRFDYGTHTIPAGHIDRVHHVEATLPDDPSVSTQRELHAYSFVLETNHHEPNGGDIRGVKGIVRGNGGQANLRSAHFATQGYNGHTGDLTGVLADVFHSDVAPTDPAIGKSAAFLGQVGAGVSDGFILRGRETPGYAGVWPNVKYGFRVGTSTNAVKPTIANFFAHGGGGGALFRGVKSDIDETILFDVSALGKVVGQLFNSGNVVVANDSVATITPLSSTGFVLVWAQTTSANWIIRYYRVGASPAMGTVATGGSAASTTGALTGTTGTSGNLTISAKSDGTIDIENRSGATRTVYYAFIGG